MKIDNIISGAKDLITRSGLKIKEHSPELLLIAGVGGIIAGTVLACRATIKAQKIKEEMKTSFKEIDDCLADESLAEVYTEEDAKTDRRNVQIQTVCKIGGAYLWSGIIFAGSLACLFASNKIQNDRVAGAIAFGNTAMAALNGTYSRLKEKYGQEAADEIRYGIEKVKTTDPELYSSADGSGGPVETETLCLKGDCAEIEGCSPYARFIDRKCGVWDKSEDMMLMTLKGIEHEFNNVLRARQRGKHPGYVFLAEVFQRLGIPRDRWPKNAAMVGWLYDENDPSLQNHISFGQLYPLPRFDSSCGDIDTEMFEKAILVDFNVDGIIYDRL